MKHFNYIDILNKKFLTNKSGVFRAFKGFGVQKMPRRPAGQDNIFRY